MGFKIQAKDQAWYFFTLVVQPASIQAFIEGTMGQSESGEKQCHITVIFQQLSIPAHRERDLWHKVCLGLDSPKVDLPEKYPLHLCPVLQPR